MNELNKKCIREGLIFCSKKKEKREVLIYSMCVGLLMIDKILIKIANLLI